MGHIIPLTEKQRELLDDKLELYRLASVTGNMELRDYERRSAEALAAALAIVDEAISKAEERS